MLNSFDPHAIDRDIAVVRVVGKLAGLTFGITEMSTCMAKHYVGLLGGENLLPIDCLSTHYVMLWVLRNLEILRSVYTPPDLELLC